ncbi:MAG TPA: hypothetical protein VMH80_18335 [Bryobacteraceae bacterium]|nr:hypothetical protein [Bryobacteraceae bacterium]
MTGINNAGQLVGYYNTSTVFQGFVDSNGTFLPVTDPSAFFATPRAISNSGEIVGEITLAGPGEHGFTDVGGQFATLDYPGALNTNPTGVNSSGQIIGYYFNGGNTLNQGFFDSGGQLSPFNDPGADQTLPFGINDSGEIVGFISAGLQDHSFIYTNGTFTQFDVPGSLLTIAYGVNDLGQIMGLETDAQGLNHIFVATPETATAPEPSLAVVVLLLATGLAGYRRRSAKRASKLSL